MKISIITINYNNVEGLKKTLNAVFTQTVAPDEYIVIDGGSTDGSREVLEKISTQLTYWVSEKDNGIFHAMNKGIKKCTGDYVLFLNSSDVFAQNNVIEYAKTTLRGGGGGYYFGNTRYKNARGGIIEPPYFLPFRYLFKHSLNHQSTFIRLDLLKKRPYREDLQLMSDWEDMFYHFAVKKDEKFYYLDTLITHYDETGISSLQGKTATIEKQKVLESYFTQEELQKILGKNKWQKKWFSLKDWITICLHSPLYINIRTLRHAWQRKLNKPLT